MPLPAYRKRQAQRFFKEFKSFPKDVQREFRPKLRAAASEALGDVKRNASWSNRIPQAAKVGLRFGKRFQGVTLYVNRKRARHARPWENAGKPGSFRHRVFGQDVWVSQRARPFFFKVAPEWHEDVQEKLLEVVDQATREHGFK